MNDLAPIPELHEVHSRVGITVLDIAKGLIYGEKEADYGTALESFDRIARGWSVILGVEITAEQVALSMDWLKTCRLINTPGHQDSLYDKAGYTGCYEKIMIDRENIANEPSIKSISVEYGGTPRFGKSDDLVNEIRSRNSDMDKAMGVTDVSNTPGAWAEPIK